MWRPWKRTEKRSADYTDAVVASILANAGNVVSGDPRETSAVETAAGLYGRCFAAASVTPQNSRTAAVTAAIREHMGRGVIRQGESVLEIEVSPGGLVRLLVAASWDVSGPADEALWRYRLNMPGPSSTETRPGVASAGVVHVRYGVQPARPWRGIPPWQGARVTSAILAGADLRLGEEAGGSTGHLLPLPQGPTGGDDDPMAALAADIKNGRGRPLIVETTASGFGEGRGSAPQRDWQANRFGPNPPDGFIGLRNDAEQCVMAACGIPRGLQAASDGTLARESWRQFAMSSLEPVAELIAEELARKLDVPGLRFDFSGLWAHDQAGRALSFKNLVAGGMEVERAAGLSGLLGDAA